MSDQPESIVICYRSSDSVLCLLTSVLWRLSVRQQQPDFPAVGFGNDIGLPQRAFPFGCFLGQDMIAVRFAEDKFTGSGSFKPFGSSTIGFNFRHGSSLSLPAQAF